MLGPQAIFRCEAGGSTGLGHAVRCAALAGRLRQAGWRVAVAISDDGYAAVPDLAALPRLRPEALLDVPADLVVIDGYDFGIDLEQKLRKAGRKLLVIDDAPTRPHDADILLDSTLGRVAEDYRKIAPSALVLAGPAYVPIRQGFRVARAKRRDIDNWSPISPVQRVLISMGGTDPFNHTGMILTALAEYSAELTFVVVMGPRADHLGSVKNQISQMKGVELHIAPPNIAELMASCDLAIGAGGTSTWERCCIGLPSHIIIIAENQRLGAEALAAAGGAILSESNPASIHAALTALLRQPDTRLALSDRGRALIDGRGLDRILCELTQPRTILGGHIKLRPLEIADWPAIISADFNESPDRFSTEADFVNTLEGTNIELFGLFSPETPNTLLGFVTLRVVSTVPDERSISISISASARRRGIAREGLRLVTDIVPSSALIARFDRQNPSHGVFASLGYTSVAPGIYRLAPRRNGTIKA